jgi:hypothetical protein
VALAPDDPARAKIAELRAKNATKQEILDAMDTYEVSVSILVKALSPGHAQAIISELMNHMVETHLDPGLAAISAISEARPQEWLDGPLFGGSLNG